MRLIDPMLMEFDREASTTRKLLERMPDVRLAWKPHPKSMTLQGLSWHLATIPAWVAAGVLLDGADLATRAKVPAPDTTAAIVEGFAANCAAAKGAMNQLDDTKLLASWKLSAGGIPILEMPRAAFLRSLLLNHSVHHRGQLSVYLRLIDVPVPSIYGPTADENPFGKG
ncbi:MAG TPA: DinB family protein [Thermoanaerobaculia bacterium]